MNNIIKSTRLLHSILKDHLKSGDKAIDATVGNGNDTLFLLEQVGDSGKVIGFDIQEEAIKNTRNKCLKYKNLKLHNIGHENLNKYINEKINVIIFNLGYLPNSDKFIITKSESTLKALNLSINVLDIGGILSIISYSHHEGEKKEESENVKKWVLSLNSYLFKVVIFKTVNTKTTPPSLYLIQKLK